MGNHLKKIGFFGGSFDPIHFGHINLAIQLQEIHRLDEVLFCPATCSPHKLKNSPCVSKEQRYAMVKLALQGIKNFTITDVEIKQENPSFTIDTIRALLKEGKQVEYRLLLGYDLLDDFMSWKEVEELVRLAPPLIGTRSHTFKKNNNQFLPTSVAKSIEEGMTQISTMEISSTHLRERLKSKRYCGHLIPAKVLDYIHSNDLY